jgi:hypothetical protein
MPTILQTIYLVTHKDRAAIELASLEPSTHEGAVLAESAYTPLHMRRHGVPFFIGSPIESFGDRSMQDTR